MESITDCNHIVIKNKPLVNGNQCLTQTNVSHTYNQQKMSTEEQFRAAVNVIRSLPKNGKHLYHLLFLLLF